MVVIKVDAASTPQGEKIDVCHDSYTDTRVKMTITKFNRIYGVPMTLYDLHLLCPEMGMLFSQHAVDRSSSPCEFTKILGVKYNVVIPPHDWQECVRTRYRLKKSHAFLTAEKACRKAIEDCRNDVSIDVGSANMEADQKKVYVSMRYAVEDAFDDDVSIDTIVDVQYHGTDVCIVGFKNFEEKKTPITAEEIYEIHHTCECQSEDEEQKGDARRPFEDLSENDQKKWTRIAKEFNVAESKIAVSNTNREFPNVRDLESFRCGKMPVAEYRIADECGCCS